MIKTFTQNDVIRYIYNETSDIENAEIESALMIDSNLLKCYQEYSLMKRKLQRAIKEPGERILKNVLAYSKSLDIQVDQ